MVVNKSRAYNVVHNFFCVTSWLYATNDFELASNVSKNRESLFLAAVYKFIGGCDDSKKLSLICFVLIWIPDPVGFMVGRKK